MPPKKLSDSEKKEIVQLYGQPEESTSTLASRFGVSSSTISRVLKQVLSDDEYNNLVQQKRTGSQSPSSTSEVQDSSEPDSPEQADSGKTSGREPAELAEAIAEEETPELDYPKPIRSRDLSDDDASPIRRRRRRSRPSSSQDDDAIQLPIAHLADMEREHSREDHPVFVDADPRRVSQTAKSDADDDLDNEHHQDDDSFEDLDDDELIDTEDDFSDDLDDSDDFDDEDDEDDDDPLESGDPLASLHFRGQDLVQIYPFSSAELPRTCYLVIDRSAELITRPLQEFGELGDLPSAELSENTLPVFDNHRVAKRFANRRTQRIVKIPDSRILRKTMPYLQAKGITRLLIDGQVYSLID